MRIPARMFRRETQSGSSRAGTSRHTWISLAHPAKFMVLVWTANLLLFKYGPVKYLDDVGLATWAWMAAAIALFCASTQLGISLKIRPFELTAPPRIQRALVITAILGLVGILLLSVDKIYFSGLDYSQDMATLRFERDVQAFSGIEVNRTPLLFIGYPIFSFSYCAIVLFVLFAERLRGSAVVLGQISILSPVLYGYLYASRGNLLLLFYLLGGALIVRRMCGLTGIAKCHNLRLTLTLFLAAFIIYSNYTWEDRRLFSNISRYYDFVQIVGPNWRIEPKPWVGDAVERNVLSDATAMNMLSYSHYYVHSFISLDKIRLNQDRLSPNLGFFEIGLLSPLARVFSPGAEPVQRMTEELRVSDLLGYFVSAWGALFLDFGFAGTMLAIILWGAASSFFYRQVLRQPGVGSQLAMSGVIASILVSPMNSPVGMSNSLLILLAMVAGARLARASPAAQIREVVSSPVVGRIGATPRRVISS